MGHEPSVARELVVGRGRRVRLRSIRRNDAQALVDMALRFTAEDLRLRFFSTVRPEIGALTALLTQFHPARHIAVAAYDPGWEEGDGDLLGVVRPILSPDGTRGEFANMVARTSRVGAWDGR